MPAVLRALCLALSMMAAEPRRWDVAAWNLFDLPEQAFDVASEARMQRVPAALAQLEATLEGPLDAIALSELYVAAHRRQVLDGLAALGLRHHTDVLQGVPLVDPRLGGVVLASRWPIERARQMRFSGACHGLDCLTVKGAIAASVLRPGPNGPQRAHIVATHFYLGRRDDWAASRLHQAHQLRAFIETLEVGADEPLILAGDLNAPRNGDAPAILAALGAAMPEPRGPQAMTFVGERHPLSGSPRRSAAQRCAALHAGTAREDAYDGKWIDYVVALGAGARPRRAELQAHMLLAGQPYALSRTSCSMRSLSDHLPVVGSLLY